MKSWSKRYSTQGGSNFCAYVCHPSVSTGTCTPKPAKIQVPCVLNHLCCHPFTYQDLFDNWLLLIHNHSFLLCFGGISGEIGQAVVHTFQRDIEPKLSINRYSPHPKKFSQLTMIFYPCSHQIISDHIYCSPDISTVDTVCPLIG